MTLTPAEQIWLDEYRKALAEQHYGVVSRMLIYGSKARGNDTPDSDLDILLIIKNEACHLKRALRRRGHLLAAASEAAPSIMVYTETEWEQRKASGSSFRKAVDRDAVTAL